MIGIITQTAYPYTTSYQLAKRYQKFLDGSILINLSTTTPFEPTQFSHLIFVVDPPHPNIISNVPPGVSISWVPLWNHISNATPEFINRVDQIICHTFHTAEVVDGKFHCASKMIHCPIPLAKRPMAGDSICRRFFMVVGKSLSTPNPRCPFILDLLNQTDEFHINLYAVDNQNLGPEPGIFPFKHVHPNFGFKRYSDEIYFNGGDVLLLPSKRESLGLNIYEAVERGIPTIAFNIPTVNEACFEDCMVEAFNLDKFYQKMKDVQNSNIYYHKYRCMELLQRHHSQQFVNLFK